MSISAYGSITVTDLLDTATYIYYSATNTSTLNNWHTSPQTNDEYIGIYSGPPTDSGQPAHPTNAIYSAMDISKYVGNTGPQGVSVTKTETEYYRKLAGGQAPQSSTTGSTTIPEYVDGCTYYTRTITYLSAGGPVKGAWQEATTLTNQIKDAYEAQIAASHAELKTKKIIQDTSGVTVAAGINGADVTEGTISTYGYNTIMAPDYLGLRYNAINLAKLTTAALEFYNPSISSQGQKMMELKGNGLFLYRPLESGTQGPPSIAAQLTTTGLNISAGSITLGSSFAVTNEGAITATSGTIGGWYLGNNFLSTDDDGTPGSGVITLSQGITLPSPSSPGSDESIRDNGVLPYDTQLAFTVSNQFGVTTNGTLYASGAQINGELSGQTIDDINDSLNTLGDTVTNQAATINKIQAICIEEAANITGIVLSKGDYQLSITSDSLTFQNQGANIAYLSNQALSIPSAKMTSDLTLGPFKWIIGQNRLILMRA